MVAAIAVLSGHDIHSDQIRTFILLCLLGDATKEIFKDTGIKVGQGFTKAALQKIPGKVLIEINKKVQFRLLTKAGEKGAVNFMKMVPVAGGVIGGTFDSVFCIAVGTRAKKLFLS